jgi:IS30 family transposase
MEKYQHLSQKEREEIYIYQKENYTITKIAELIGRNKSTISREIRRNATNIEARYNNSPKKNKQYLPDRAQNKYEQKRRKSKSPYPLKNGFIHAYVINHLKNGWSPELISGRIKLDFNASISHECIYQYIYSKHAKDKGYRLWEYLVNKRKKRKKKQGRKVKKSNIPNRIDISERPISVGKRNRTGDWEGDTIFGKGNGSALATFNDRSDKRVKIKKLPRKTADYMKDAAISVLSKEPREFARTLTLDNGAENSKHSEISSCIGVKVYFARPYHSWERGSNERTNGLIRRYFPKKTNFDDVSEEQIALVEEIINNRPMKCLNWKTPNEVYQDNLSKLLSKRNQSVALES